MSVLPPAPTVCFHCSTAADDRLKNARTLVTTLQKPNNTIPQALTLILGKILDDNCEVINFIEERLQLLAAAYSKSRTSAPNHVSCCACAAVW